MLNKILTAGIIALVLTIGIYGVGNIIETAINTPIQSEEKQ